MGDGGAHGQEGCEPFLVRPERGSAAEEGGHHLRAPLPGRHRHRSAAEQPWKVLVQHPAVLVQVLLCGVGVATLHGVGEAVVQARVLNDILSNEQGKWSMILKSRKFSNPT